MPNSKKKIMILGAGKIQFPVIMKAKEMGLFVITVDFDKNAPGFKYSDIKLLISTHDKKAILKEAVKHKINGILTTSDYPVRVVAYVANKLKLNALNQDAAFICTNKYLLRKSLTKTNLNYPKYIIAETLDDLSKVHFFPAIIKPIDSSASRGVKKVMSKDELIKEFEISKSYSISKKVIIEEFIEGKEFSVESLTYNGRTNIIAITEKNKIGEDKGYFVEYSHKIPANITKQESKLIKQTTLDIIKSINLDNTSSHTEIILSNNKAYLVEIGARLGGDYIASDLVYLSKGIDMLKNIIKMSMNEKINIKTKYNMYSAIQFITSKNYLSAKNFIKSNNKQIIKFDIKPYKNIVIKNSFDRLGYIIIQTSTKNELENLLKTINSEN